jgi:hypothetical protein
MTGPAEFDIGNPGHPVLFHIAVAEGAIQLGNFFMMDVIEEDRLIDRRPGENREQEEKDLLRFDLKPVVSNDGKKKDDEDGKKNNEFPFHGG